ncbi:MAG: hypothetical protein ABIS27_03835, partial [Longimicrobiales bacterium]
LVMVTLMILGRVEDHLLPNRNADRTLNIELLHTEGVLAEVETLLTGAGLVVTSLEVEKRQNDLFVSYHTRGSADEFEKTLARLLDREGVRRVVLL